MYYNRSLLLCVLMLSPLFSLSQSKLGYIYHGKEDSYTKMRYDRVIHEKGDVYTTIYKCYDPKTSRHSIDVVVTHFKSKKKISIDMTNTLTGREYSGFQGTKYVEYDDPSENEYFGKVGGMRRYAGDHIPAEIMVSFMSDRYENLKLHSLLSSVFYMEFLILDK